MKNENVTSTILRPHLHFEKERKNAVLAKSVILIDVMLNGSFVCQVQMPHCALFPVSDREVCKYVIDKRPSLKGKAFKIAFSTAAPLLKQDTNVGG